MLDTRFTRYSTVREDSVEGRLAAERQEPSDGLSPSLRLVRRSLSEDGSQIGKQNLAPLLQIHTIRKEKAFILQ